MFSRLLPVASAFLLASVGCDAGADASEQPEKAEKTEKAEAEKAPEGAPKGSAEFCDVRSNENSPNYGTCWAYPGGFPSPHLCAGYRGTASASPCPEADTYVGKCHFGALDKTTKRGDATSTVTRAEFFVYHYDVAGVGPKLADGRKAECEGEKGAWIPR